MTPQQALELLTNATAQLPGSRQEHLMILEALQIIDGVVNPPVSDPKD